MYRKIGVSNRLGLVIKFSLIVVFGLYAAISGRGWPLENWAYIGFWILIIAVSIIWDFRKAK